MSRDPGELPDPLLRFLELVDAGEYWESHEALEDAWRSGGSDFYQGLILYASAFVHARRGTAHGIDAQLRKALEALGPYPEAYLGLDVEGLRRHARRCRALVEEHRGEPDPDWEDLLPRPRLAADPERIRGDEPELEASADG